MTSVDSPLARKLTALATLSPPDLEALAGLQTRRSRFIHRWDTARHEQSAFILTEGWAFSVKAQKGGAQRILDFRVPGDFLGLRSVLLRTADDLVQPITPVVAAEVRLADILHTVEQAPRLGLALMLSATRDEAILADHIASLGRRDAAEKTGHFLLELAARLDLAGIGGRDGFDCPLSTYLMADALGLSVIHVQKVLRKLSEDGLVTFEKGRVRFDDFAGLVAFADFDMAYFSRQAPILT